MVLLRDFTLKNKIVFFMTLIAFTVFFGSLGYAVIKIFVEHQNTTFLNALYWTVVTLSTLGFYPQDIAFTSSVGRLFTIVFVLLGVMIIFGGLQTIISSWVDVKMRRLVDRPDIHIPREDHIIICGNPESAKGIIQDFKKKRVQYIVISEHGNGSPRTLHASPWDDDTLLKAGVKKARALLALMDDDENMFITLTAKKLRKDIPVVALVENKENIPLLKSAGADTVLWFDAYLGRLLAVSVENPYMFYVWEMPGLFKDYTMDELRVDNYHGLLKVLVERNKGLIVLGVLRGNDIIYGPKADEKIEEGDVLIVYGPSHEIEKLRQEVEEK